MSAAERQRIREIREAFDYHDRNHDGRLDYPDYGQVLRALGVFVSESEIEAAKTEFSFPMTWDEFLPLVNRKLQQGNRVSSHLEAETVRAFQTFDVRSKGKVSLRDLRHFLTSLGERISADEFDLALKYAKIPADQAEVNYTEFLRILHASSSS